MKRIAVEPPGSGESQWVPASPLKKLLLPVPFLPTADTTEVTSPSDTTVHTADHRRATVGEQLFQNVQMGSRTLWRVSAHRTRRMVHTYDVVAR